MSDDNAPGRFDAAAERYAASRHHARGASLGRLLELTAPELTSRVLDVATGGGHTALAFAPLSSRVVAYDPAPNMLRAVRKSASEHGLPNLGVVQGLAEDLPFGDGAFDIALSRIAPHHFSDLTRAVREMARVTRPGGVVAVADRAGYEDRELDEFNHRVEVLHDPTHVRSLPASRWRAVFEAAGLFVSALEELVDQPAGLFLSDWCRVTGTPPANAVLLGKLLGEAPDHIKDAYGIRLEGADVRLAKHLVVVVAGRRP